MLEKMDEENINLKKVKLNREWSIWENYDTKPGMEKQDYSELLKEVYSFPTIIDFWQFWNIYPGAIPENIFYDGQSTKFFFKEKYRIISIGIFKKGIRPEWESEYNEGGKIFIMEYLIQYNSDNTSNFLKDLSKGWTKLVLSVIGEIFNCSEYINGIRLVDKSIIGKKIIYRFELWIHKKYPLDKIENLKKKLSNDFGCAGISTKDIPLI